MFLAKKMPISPTTTETIIPIQIACPATVEAASGSFSPIRRAIMAVVPMLKPIAIA